MVENEADETDYYPKYESVFIDKTGQYIDENLRTGKRTPTTVSKPPSQRVIVKRKSVDKNREVR